MESAPHGARGFELLDTESSDPEVWLSVGTRFIDYFRAADPLEQQALRDQMPPQYYGILRAFASRVACRAVQRKSIADVERGLVALALEGGRWDYRYTLMRLCLLHHSAAKLGADVDGLFRKAAALGHESGNKLLLGYLARGQKRLEPMGFKEGVDEKGEFDCVVEGWRGDPDGSL